LSATRISLLFLNFLGFLDQKNTPIAASSEPADIEFPYPQLKHFSKLVEKRFFLSKKLHFFKY
jgi:hypothetical protein